MFIVEDGTGVANANSLTSVDFADAYHTDRLNYSWLEFSPERKQALLIKATDYFMNTFSQALIGDVVSSSQALPFPRTVDYVNVGNPVRIQQVIAALALVADTMELAPIITRGKKRVKIGPIDIEYDGTNSQAPDFVAITKRISTWLKTATLNPFVARLQRV